MKNIARSAFILICIAAMALPGFSMQAPDSPAAGQELKRVFVLNSYHYGLLFSDSEMRGIDDVFEKSPIRVETYIKYMDMKRTPSSPEYFRRLKELIREGYKGIRFDAIIACDNDALEFIVKNRDGLFPGVPVVFSGINDFEERLLGGRRDITGTVESDDFAATIGIALKLRPAAKNIVVVTDNTTTGKAYRSEIEKIRPDFPQDLGFKYLSLGDSTLEELAQKLSALKNDSVVLLLQHFVDRKGTNHAVKSSASFLANSSSVPVFGVNDSRMGLGVLGGKLVSGYSQGETAAGMVLKILGGTDVRTIPILLESPNRYMFDYNVMQRFRIEEGDLPQGSIIRTKPVSILDRYRNEMLFILVVFIVLCSFIVYLLMEIRRRKRAETERERLESQLLQAQKMEAVGQLAGGVAHDFNNILTSIMGFGSLLNLQLKGNDKGTHYVSEMMHAADRGAALTQSLLAFSRKQHNNPQPLDLNAAIRKTENILARTIGEDIKLSIQLTEENTAVQADSNQMAQILINLAANARDAMPKGGALTIRTGRTLIDEAFMKMHGYGTSGEYVVMTVEDSGIGMDAATCARIFEPFFTTKEVGKGTGLGLSMVYGIVKQHNGFIDVYSEPGTGTVFKLYLPALETKAETQQEDKRQFEPESATETILIVEDDATVRQVLTEMLQEFGHTVIEACDGDEAVTKFMENRDEIHLVLMDVIMPGKSGGDAYQELKAIQPDLKIILMSGYAGDYLSGKLIMEKDVHFIEKPIAPKELFAKIRSVLAA